jgi:hypothetical protein
MPSLNIFAALARRWSPAGMADLQFQAPGGQTVNKSPLNLSLAGHLLLPVAETYKARGLEKLGLKTRAELVRYGSSQGWLDFQRRHFYGKASVKTSGNF